MGKQNARRNATIDYSTRLAFVMPIKKLVSAKLTESEKMTCYTYLLGRFDQHMLAIHWKFKQKHKL